MHITKLKEAKPSIDAREPTQFRHIKKKLKKNQMLEGNFTSQFNRFRKIYRDWERKPHPIGEDDSYHAEQSSSIVLK